MEYISCKHLVKIICPKHGEFEQTPDVHINHKHGCRKCSNNSSEGERRWLDNFNIPDDPVHRQVRINIDKFNDNGKRKFYIVDRF